MCAFIAPFESCLLAKTNNIASFNSSSYTYFKEGTTNNNKNNNQER